MLCFYLVHLYTSELDSNSNFDRKKWESAQCFTGRETILFTEVMNWFSMWDGIYQTQLLLYTEQFIGGKGQANKNILRV
jgi:hypothetical protein